MLLKKGKGLIKGVVTVPPATVDSDCSSVLDNGVTVVLYPEDYGCLDNFLLFYRWRESVLFTLPQKGDQVIVEYEPDNFSVVHWTLKP